MDADTWASLPHDLLVEVLRLLAATAVVRCTGACRPWRRAIVGNASCLRPRPDRFNPNLLIGFFYRCWSSSYLARLQYVPGPFENLFAMDTGDTAWDTWENNHNPHCTSISFLITWSACHGVDVRQYDAPLSSRDRFIPAAELGAFKTCTYVLVTDDGGGAGDSSAVWILALSRECDVKRGVIYQIFSPASGEWGPVKRSAKFEKGLIMADMRGVPNDMVVRRGSVYWLVRLFAGNRPRTARRCVFAIDVRTERTWTIELPEKHKVLDIYTCKRLVLAMSEDGRLSLILQLRGHKIEVWVHVGDDSEWTLRRAMDLHSLIPGCPRGGGLAHHKGLLTEEWLRVR